MDGPARIEVTFGIDGSITAETIGIKGKECLSQIAMLEDLLEAETMDSQYTAEYHEQSTPNMNFGGQEHVNE